MGRIFLGLIVALYLVGVGIALFHGTHEPFFLGIGTRGGQGVDFFCVPKAYLNLWTGTSAFDTWSYPPYGPHATWFVLHPAVAIWVGGPLSWLPPWTAYGLFVIVTLGLFAFSAALISHHAPSRNRKRLVWAVLFLSPLTYWLLFVGNVHGLVVVAATLLLVGLHELRIRCARPAMGITPAAKVGVGLLLSLLSKPVLVFVIPGLLFARLTRKPTIVAVIGYAVLSSVFLVVPGLNPQAIGLSELLRLLASPAWVRQNLNIYTNGFHLSAPMLDNGMHWMHMVAQSSYTWDHAQVFSLPVLLKGLVGATVSVQYLALFPVLLSVTVLRQSTEEARLECLKWLVILALALHFLVYAISWEYQYTQLLVVSAACAAVLIRSSVPRWLGAALSLSLLTLQLPSPYILLSANGLDAADLAWMRAFRVLPALAATLTATWMLTVAHWRSSVTQEQGETCPLRAVSAKDSPQAE